MGRKSCSGRTAESCAAELVEVDTDGELDVVNPTREQVQLGVEPGNSLRGGVGAVVQALAQRLIEVGAKHLVERLGLRRDLRHRRRALLVGESGMVIVAGKFFGIEWLLARL